MASSSDRYVLAFTVDAFKQNFRNLIEDLDSLLSATLGAVLLAGRSGGQIVPGGTAASEDLTLTSTKHATKDRIFFGSAQTSAYDELNDRIGIGTPSPAMDLTISKTFNGDVGMRALNQSTGTSANSRLTASTNTDASRVQLIAFGTSYTAATLYGLPNLTGWQTLSSINSSGLVVGTVPSVPLVLGTSNAERMRIDSNGNVEIGTAALATTATNGFLYIPSCAGTPTGTPTAKTGRVPLVYDTTNNKLYAYNGAWKSVTLA